MSEHPFAQYIRILGKGRNGQRPLSREEAYSAMDMIYRYDVEPEQLGAFLMLMRVKEETAEELAGFVQAVRESIPRTAVQPRVAIDWPCYAGKRRHLPWHLLAALVLAERGYPVFMHGTRRDDERLYVADALQVLGLAPAHSLEEAERALFRQRFAYLDVEQISPLTDELMDNRCYLGLRSPIHTVARMLRPFNAELTLQPVFHPNYAVLHQQSSALLGLPRVIAFKGEGGEAERVPDRACTVFAVKDGEQFEEQWAPLLPPGRYEQEQFPDLDHFVAVWEGRVRDLYAEAAITGTIALCLHALQAPLTQGEALAEAREIWKGRACLVDNARCA